jgi:K+-sensing histidine kinase KdpD
VGYVASTGDPRIVSNIVENTIYYRNPLLPDTKSEIALPLVVNQKVIGVLDVHSQDVNAFTQDDADVLQTLADELAYAIDNARLLQQFQEATRQLTSLQNQISKDVWVGLSQTIQVAGYQLDASGIHPVFKHQILQEKLHAPFSIPIKVRGEVVAWLDLWPRNDTLAPGELTLLEALKERLTQAVESARIFEETQRRAGREQAVNEFVTALSGSLDLDVLLATAVKNLGKIPDVTEVRLTLQDTHTADPVREFDNSNLKNVEPGSEEG